MDIDLAFEQLLPHLNANCGKKLLWVTDENLLSAITSFSSASFQHDDFNLITNRYDVAQKALNSNLNCLFNDFDFSHIKDNSLECVIYRVSKEKPVVNHIINQAFRCLKKNGKLIMAGEKSDGCKTYIDKASRMFGKKVPAQKNGNVYVGVISKCFDEHSDLLDDKNYCQSRPTFEFSGQMILSKPGLFGWNKEDKGSTLLIETAKSYLQEHQLQPKSLLDLGCGYGYLTLASAQWPSITHRVATDNNAASVNICRENVANFELQVDVSADDCGSNITNEFELILCNPPFHQGFTVDNSLTDKFLNNTHRLLKKRGIALFVVNQFIMLEKKAQPLFNHVELLINNGQFKVIALSH